jgi:phosphate transport system permease protein
MSAPDIAITREITVNRALRGRRVDTTGLVFQGLLLMCLLACLFFIIVLVGTVWSDGWPVIQDRGTDFLRSDLSRCTGQDGECLPGLQPAGIAQGIFGSLALAMIVVIVSFPLGVATAVYLEEYAGENRLTRFVRLNIRNLSGVPSVVYGLLGLAVFVQIMGTNRPGDGFTGGRTIISGGLTLSILVLPIVIITASEALRAVPDSLREGGYGVGATKWDVIRRLVLPNAFAGILTGTVLSLSRALGEVAPLILVGAFYGTFFTTGDASFTEKFTTTYTALPQIVFQWATDSDKGFNTDLAAAAILCLLFLTLLANLAAVLLRNRYEKRW